ncbi:MAG: type II secretion system F family protein, partial [Candidatus Nanohaloarchaea archaeon]
AFLIVLGIMMYLFVSTQLGGATLILGLIVGVLPYGIISFLKNRAVREMEDQFPSFLKDLAESKRGGMTILQAFESAKDSDYGRLNHEIEKIHTELTWGIPFPEVMERFSRRMDASPVIQESISILLQSFRSGGNITKTIESIAEDASKLKETLQKKNSKIKQQIFIMYVIYFLFIGITIGIYTMMSELLGLGTAGQGALQGLDFLGEGGGTTNYCNGQIAPATPMCETAKLFGFVPQNVTDFTSAYATKFSYGNMAYYKSLLFTMLMIQGICTGAVAGQIGEGSPSAGVKHAMIMLPIAFIAFMYLVGLAGV